MDGQDSADRSRGVEEAVAVLKAVADPTRFRVLWALARGEHSVGQLAELVGAHVAAVSQHLARLRAAGLVVSRREGTRIYYRAAGAHVRALLEGAVLAARAEPEGPAPASVAGNTAVAAPAGARLRPRPVNG
ncbi:helix-turn-helix transcriptional regulator [Streptomyces sp. AV19]|uniref:ArsR/SmtB family transcription factor n=1 Tax=Streptomyces sp. AV19 TaxID=2793068 RepID=UPI0018FEDEC8|nr:metalloregulator ArsR/SmtB family transcription factor [Streptomyces sp. AV19]MBH1938830.1 helix-turn-helix transcriptional regulator [Streptomyces sp. AV19]MDG4534763.1 metalloregulator ArsR/SmtB family transcription factor [Streptomyces sp. AV19]